jgi:hypothetical protein
MDAPTNRSTEVVDSPGYCIYCGIDDGQLTDEHIIPRAVNGHILLRRSTCKIHQTMTSAIEGDIQSAQRKGLLADIRAITGMRSYKKRHERPTHVKFAFVGHDEREFRKNVPIAEAQALHHMPVFAPPRFMTSSRPLPNDNVLSVNAIANNMVGPAVERFIKRHGACGIRGTFTIPMNSFLRYLCKIAYGVHFVRRGAFDRCESPALGLLLGDRNDFGNWFGSMPEDQEVPGGGLHRVEMAELRSPTGDVCDAVLISLFNNLAPCTYVVITRCPSYQSMVA